MAIDSYQDLLSSLEVLRDCRICPRNCGVDRFSSKLGYCQLDAKFNIASITLHKGEEPVIVGKKGICNIFFPHCNLQCIYCQNYQISCNIEKNYQVWELPQIIEKLLEFIESGVYLIGFVSPSQCVVQMKIIIEALRRTGKKFITVYNSNGYDKVNTLRELESYIDVYLPDFKYIDPNIAELYSYAHNYPEIAKAAILEMYRQKGSYISINDDGYVESGLIVRHLVLPGESEQSIRILEYISEYLSTGAHISLMSQYYPTYKATHHPILNRTLEYDEYQKVVHKMNELGFYHGWVQELQSQKTYRPNFEEEKPFGI